VTARAARRRREIRSDPETVAALAVTDRYAAMLGALAAAGDRFAPERLRGVRWTQREIREWGLDFIARLRVRGYEREIDRLTRTEPLPLYPGEYRA
jgi:hypothetical protein